MSDTEPTAPADEQTPSPAADEQPPVAPTPEPDLDEEIAYDPIPVFTVAPSSPPFMYVLGDTFVAHLSGRTPLLRRPLKPLRIRLAVPFRLIEAIADVPPRGQLYAVLQDRGESRTVATIEDADMFESRAVVRGFWQAYGEHQGARLGESRRSSA